MKQNKSNLAKKNSTAENILSSLEMKCQIPIVFTVRLASSEWPCVSSVRIQRAMGRGKGKKKKDQL